MVYDGWLRGWGLLGVSALITPRHGRDASNSDRNEGEDVGELHFERLFEVWDAINSVV